MDNPSKCALTDAGLQQSEIINERLECKDRMGAIKRGKKRCESPVTPDRCQLAKTLTFSVFLGSARSTKDALHSYSLHWGK